MTQDAATVVLVDDDPSIRDAVRRLLQSVGLRVDVFESVQALAGRGLPKGPACLVLDVRLPGQNGLDFQAELAKARVPLPVIFITGHGDIPMSVRAMKAGAVEFLTKPFRDQDLLDAILLAVERDRTRLQADAGIADLRSRAAELTAREFEVMRGVASGLANKQIANELGLSEITVKAHRGQVMRKMNARSIADLVRMADKLTARLGKPRDDQR